MLIGVTDTLRGQDALGRYLEWLRAELPGAELLVLSSREGDAEAAGRCRGIVMTGGGDVDPRLYGAPDALSVVAEVNEERDRFEIGIVKTSQQNGIPLLGICRGAQIANVAFGGSLVPDLQQAGYEDHRKTPAGDRRHEVRLEPGSVLAGISGGGRGEVNSSHHQAVLLPGAGLRVTARSPDGVFEGIERDKKSSGPFLLLVQWHPERMLDRASPLSAGVIAAFRTAVQSVQQT